MRLLILFSDIDEFAPFQETMKPYLKGLGSLWGLRTMTFSCSGIDADAVCFGIGKVNAATGAALALSEKKYDGVINTGWSGAVSGVVKGDIVVSESCTECDFDLTPVGLAPGVKPDQPASVYVCDSFLTKAARSVPHFRFGKLGTGDFFLTDPQKKADYKKQFDICAFDMESGALASVCCRLDVPFVSIRKISDSADDAALSEYTDTLQNDNTAFADIVLSIFGALSEA